MCICVFVMIHMWMPEGLKIGPNAEKIFTSNEKLHFKNTFPFVLLFILQQPPLLC